MHVGGIFATLVAHGSCVALASSKHTAADNQDCLPTFRLRASHGRTVARLSEAWTHCCALVQRRSLREAGVLIRTSYQNMIVYKRHTSQREPHHPQPGAWGAL